MVGRKPIYNLVCLLFLISVSFSIEASLTRDQALDYIWLSKTPQGYLQQNELYHQENTLSSIAIISERRDVHTHYEIDRDYNNYDPKFLKHSNYLIWGFVKYFKYFTPDHELYQNYTWTLRDILIDQVDYFNRFFEHLIDNQDSKYKTGIARGYLELAKLDQGRKQRCLETAWSYFSSIKGKISKKIKYWKAEVIYNDYIPLDMTRLEALNLAAELCTEVQKKKKSASQNSSPKGGSKAEGKIPHYNYMIYKENKENNDELLNLINQKIQYINENSQSEDSENHDFSDHNPNDSSDNDDDDGHDHEELTENEYNEASILRNNINIQETNEDETDSPIIDFEIEESIENIQKNSNNNNEIISIENNNNVKKTDRNKKRKFDEEKIIDVYISQFPQQWLNDQQYNIKRINKDYWINQIETILEIAQNLENGKTVRINGEKEYTLKIGDDISKIRQKIEDIYNWDLRHTLDKFQILKAKKRTEWSSDQILLLRDKAEKEKCGIEELKKHFSVGDEKIKRICKDNNIKIFEKVHKKKKGNEIFHWNPEKISHAINLKKENPALSGTKIAEKIKEQFNEIPTPQSVNQILKRNKNMWSQENETTPKKKPEPWKETQVEQLIKVFNENPKLTYAQIGQKLNPVRVAGTVGKKLRELGFGKPSQIKKSVGEKNN